MNYDKIDFLLKREKLTIPKLAERIGMSKRGLYASLKNKTLNVEMLEQIAQVLNVPITKFFNSDSDDSVEGNSSEKLLQLQDLLKNRDENIIQLRKENQMLLELRDNCEEKLAQKMKEYKMLDRFFEAVKIGKYERWDSTTPGRVYSFTQTLLQEGEMGAYRLAKKLGDEELLRLFDYLFNDEEPPISK